MDFFARLGRVYAVDLLGHGHSTPGPSDALQVQICSDRLLAWL
jgi:pimeloyl-ACP methyl ester carboxylesterase